MLKQMTLDEKFLTFLDSRDPSWSYNWQNADCCACAQFCRFVYGKEPRHTAISATRWAGMTWEDQRHIWAKRGSFNELAFGDGTQDNWTFGALRERFLRAKHP